MAKTFAVLNRKGGVGKTTTALALADRLNAQGKTILLIDLDQQHNATTVYGARMDDQTTVYDVLTDPKVDITDAIQHIDGYGDIIAGDNLMNSIESDMASRVGREFMLTTALERVVDDYDYIIIDCPTALGSVVLNALMASDYVIVPLLSGDIYSKDGLDGVLKLIAQVKSNPRFNPDLQVAGALITQYEARQNVTVSCEEQIRKLCKEEGIRLFDTRIRKCCKVREAAQDNESLFNAYPSCTAAMDYDLWTDELVAVV